MRMPTASSLGRAMRCGASLCLPVVDTTTGHSEAGTWRHRYLELVSKIGHEAALQELPEQYRAAMAGFSTEGLPLNLSAEVAMAWDIRESCSRFIGNGLSRGYGPLSEYEVAGTADAIGSTADAVHVVDWKGPGHRRGDAYHQLRFLALAAARLADLHKAVVHVIRIDDAGEVSRYSEELDELDLDAFAAELFRWRVGLKEDGGPHEGVWCERCPSFQFCPAKARLAVQVATGDMLGDMSTMPPLTPERAGAAWTKLREAKVFLRRIEAACMAALAENGDRLPLPDGSELRRVACEGNEVLDGAAVFDAVAEMFGPGVAVKAVEMRATKAGIKRAVKETRPPGKVAEAERAVLERVRANGGTSRKQTTELVEVKL